ncbi:hypothetical protein C1O33_09845 [Staphylococcus schleiferi]|uniref:trypsin-like serine peptidase n=1 Tax=Staphylococcus sp. 191 TaxID=2070016 RepID=UPI0013F4B870|nr:trypsin-like peptidase domain-containing protein [Staphylococcus sp. 191]NHA37039.1 hypothetical protein [Staphylococcus schleiferi]NHB72362.1 hypothetical protein [Staphylococcus sp. 191]
MRKLLSVTVLSIAFCLTNSESVFADNRIQVEDTLSDNSLFTSKFETNNSSCTAVALSPRLVLTAAHCINNKTVENEYLGTVYPAQSSQLHTPLGKLEIYTGYTYQGKDIAILKSGQSDFGSEHYLRNKKVNLKSVNTDAQSLAGQKVYTIGYPSDKGGNAQYKSHGEVTSISGGLVHTNLSATHGQSGSGLFLEGTGELIGILAHGNIDPSNSTFSPITGKVKEWIEKQN